MNGIVAILARLSGRQKFSIVCLAFYWPVLFVLGHIQIPQIVREANVSDKSLHFLAYMVLALLVWSAAKPDKKVSWRKSGAWLVLVVVVLYGVCDEWLQLYVVGRSADVKDFAADVVGTAVGLVVLSIFSFSPAVLIATGVTIFTLTNFTRTDLSTLVPVTNSLFHFFGYAFFAMFWVRYLDRELQAGVSRLRWWVPAMALPLGLLFVVKVGSLIFGKGFDRWDVILAVTGIATAVTTQSLIGVLHRRLARSSRGSTDFR